MLPAYILIANIYTLNWDVENTLKYFNTAEEKDLISAPLYLEWAIALFKFNRFEEAKTKLLKAQELKPEDKEIQSNLALNYFMTGNMEEAERLAAQYPDVFESKLTNALIAYHNNDIDKALPELRKLSEEKHDIALTDYFIAKCYEQKNNDAKVKDYYNSAIDKCPIFFDAYKEFAKYLFSKDDYADAGRKLRKALKLDENNVEILNLLFYSCYKLVKDNVCEYNVKEAVGFAEKAENLGHFEYPEEKSELTELLKNIQEK